MKAMRLAAASVAFFTFGLAAPQAEAQGDKPRFIFILDNSTSMTESVAGTLTHGDGSQSQPGCDVDGKSTGGWKYDDSKMYLAKSAIIETISAFGAAEFALATYARTLLGQPCETDSQCTSISAGTSCVDLPEDATSQKYCAYKMGESYVECSSGVGCLRCAEPSDGNDRIFEKRQLECGRTCGYSATCPGAQVIVGFPSSGSNLADIYRWIDGVEDLPPFKVDSNREIRATAWTPLAGSISSIKDWLLNADRSEVGAGAGLLSKDATARDARAACRTYNIILVTDGADTCALDMFNDPVTAAADAYKAGINVYVVGFGTGQSDWLSRMASAGSGGKKTAYLADSRTSLAAGLGDIIVSSMPTPRCNCDSTCYDDSIWFPLKGKPCSIGTGRCKRQGVYTCNAAGDGVVCAAGAACGATPLVEGTPSLEVCGDTPGCLAPTAADCADEDCDGQIDNGLTCGCAYKPEICNGLDDDCNGVVDDIAAASCEGGVGECRPGTLVCVDDGIGGKTTKCQGAQAPQAEICDGKDNDCDGVADGIRQECFPAGEQGCSFDTTSKKWSCKGVCVTGVQNCLAGEWKECLGTRVPQAEIACDGLDNNCDGQVDENDPKASVGCYPAAAVGCDASTGKCVGVCSLGRQMCQTNPVSGKGELTCAGAVTPIQELCNSRDDDCDGSVDEDFPTLGQACNEKSCQGAGKLVCSSSGRDVECTVKSMGPTPEICDNLDNDCDGKVDEVEDGMPGVGVSCGSAVGECRPGTSVCTAGRISCTDKGPSVEVCNGLDDDCNAKVDDGVAPPGEACNPDGLASGAAIQGECQPGRFTCQGAAGWVCSGGVGPVDEVCDGKDNDCDGDIDDAADGGPSAVCLNGECVPRCREVEQPCAADRYCSNGLCLVLACRLNPCKPHELCNSVGQCYDPCEGKICAPGATCEKGHCQDCYSRGCPAGQICHKRECVADPCATASCGAGEFCSDGKCLPNCALVTCEKGQTCRKGQCQVDPCMGVACPSGYVCDAGNGACKPRRCSAVACASGEVCIEEGSEKCVSDPCEVVRCQSTELCVVQPDGSAECELLSKPTVEVAQMKPGSRGLFGCSYGGGNAPGALLWILLVLPWLARRQVRDR